MEGFKLMTTSVIHHNGTTGWWRPASVSTALAVATNVALFASADASGTDFRVPSFGSDQTMNVTVGHVIATTLVVLALGWVAAAIAARRGRPSLGAMAILGAAIAAVSTAAPLTLDADLGTRLVLAAQHLVAGAAYVAGIELIRRAEATGR